MQHVNYLSNKRLNFFVLIMFSKRLHITLKSYKGVSIIYRKLLKRIFISIDINKSNIKKFTEALKSGIYMI